MRCSRCRPIASSPTRRSPTTATSGGRGSPRTRPPTYRLAGQRLDARRRKACRPPELPFHGSGQPGPCDRRGMGGPQGRAHLGHLVRWQASSVVPLVHEAFDWAHGCSWARSWRRRRPRPQRARSVSCGETRSRCCRSAATTWPTTGRTGCRSRVGWTRQTYPGLLRQLVPQVRGRALFMARLRGQFPRAGMGLRSLRGPRRGGRDADRLPPGAWDDRHRRPRHPRRGHDRSAAGRPRRVAGGAARDRGVLLPVRRPATARPSPHRPRRSASASADRPLVPVPYQAQPALVTVLAGTGTTSEVRAVRGEHRVVAGRKAREHGRVDRGLPPRPRQHPHMGALGRVRYRVDLHLEAFALSGAVSTSAPWCSPTSINTARLGRSAGALPDPAKPRPHGRGERRRIRGARVVQTARSRCRDPSSAGYGEVLRRRIVESVKGITQVGE